MQLANGGRQAPLPCRHWSAQAPKCHFFLIDLFRRVIEGAKRLFSSHFVPFLGQISWAILPKKAFKWKENSAFFPLGIFPIKNAREKMGSNMEGVLRDYKECKGTLDRVEIIEQDSRFLKISGWIFHADENNSPESALLLDKQGVVQGFLLSGLPRPDIEMVAGQGSLASGFQGYLKSDLQNDSLIVIVPKSRCKFEVSNLVSDIQGTRQKPSDKLDENYAVKNVSCIGYVDFVNGLPMGSNNIQTGPAFKVSGWLVENVEKALLPESVYLVLTDKKEKTFYLKTGIVWREDVGKYFGNPGLSPSGYHLNSDLSMLEGKYAMKLAYVSNDKKHFCICSNPDHRFDWEITINK